MADEVQTDGEALAEPDFSQPDREIIEVILPDSGTVLRGLRERLASQFREDKECLDRAYTLAVAALEGQWRAKVKRLDELEASEDLTGLSLVPGVYGDSVPVPVMVYPERVASPAATLPSSVASDPVILAARHYGGPFTSRDLTRALDQSDPAGAPHERGRVKLALDRYVREGYLDRQEMDTPKGTTTYYQPAGRAAPISRAVGVVHARKGLS